MQLEQEFQDQVLTNLDQVQHINQVLELELHTNQVLEAEPELVQQLPINLVLELLINLEHHSNLDQEQAALTNQELDQVTVQAWEVHQASLEPQELEQLAQVLPIHQQ